MDLTFENLLAHINTVYVLLTKSEDVMSAPTASQLASWSHDDSSHGLDILRLKVYIKTLITHHESL